MKLQYKRIKLSGLMMMCVGSSEYLTPSISLIKSARALRLFNVEAFLHGTNFDL